MEETLTLERKKEYRDFEENYFWKEDYIPISQEPRLENSQGRNWKNKQIINTYFNQQHNGIKLHEWNSVGKQDGRRAFSPGQNFYLSFLVYICRRWYFQYNIF